MESRRATRSTGSIKSSDFGVPFGMNRYSSHLMMATRSTESIKSSDFGVPFGMNRYSSLLRMARGSTESIDSGVSLKSNQSKEDMTNFKGRVSPRLMDFGSDVSAVKDLNKPLDNQWAAEMAQLRIEMEEMNQELSSEVGWKHLEAPVSSCS